MCVDSGGLNLWWDTSDHHWNEQNTRNITPLYYYSQQAEEAIHLVDINDKQIVVNLQAHSQNSGVLEAFQWDRGLDRGGQTYMIQPKNIE